MKRTRNETIVRARELRRTISLPEGLLWQVLRQRPGGFKFRKQHPFGPFVIDFYCPAVRLAIEVDGSIHGLGDRPERDRRRAAFLRENGLRLIRFDAAHVLRDLDAVVRMILDEASAWLPLHHAAHGPPPQPGCGGTIV